MFVLHPIRGIGTATSDGMNRRMIFHSDILTPH